MDNNRETHIPTYWSHNTCLPMRHYGRKEVKTVKVHVFQQPCIAIAQLGHIPQFVH